MTLGLHITNTTVLWLKEGHLSCPSVFSGNNEIIPCPRCDKLCYHIIHPSIHPANQPASQPSSVYGCLFSLQWMDGLTYRRKQPHPCTNWRKIAYLWTVGGSKGTCRQTSNRKAPAPTGNQTQYPSFLCVSLKSLIKVWHIWQSITNMSWMLVPLTQWPNAGFHAIYQRARNKMEKHFKTSQGSICNHYGWHWNGNPIKGKGKKNKHGGAIEMRNRKTIMW